MQLSTFWGPDPVLGLGDTTVKKTDRTCVLEIHGAEERVIGERGLD